MWLSLDKLGMTGQHDKLGMTGQHDKLGMTEGIS
jgi:hypothetical protein